MLPRRKAAGSPGAAGPGVEGSYLTPDYPQGGAVLLNPAASPCHPGPKGRQGRPAQARPRVSTRLRGRGRAGANSTPVFGLLAAGLLPGSLPKSKIRDILAARQKPAKSFIFLAEGVSPFVQLQRSINANKY